MAYKTPTRRKGKKTEQKINLIPILDAVFILIFSLLFSVQFVKIFEIGSNVPIISNTPPPKKQKKPLALTVDINKQDMVIWQGVPGRRVKTIKNLQNSKYDLNKLHDYLIGVKKRNINEETIILNTERNFKELKYKDIVEIMDAVRLIRNTDESLYKKDQDGVDVKVKTLFSNIMFGNIVE